MSCSKYSQHKVDVAIGLYFALRCHRFMPQSANSKDLAREAFMDLNPDETWAYWSQLRQMDKGTPYERMKDGVIPSQGDFDSLKKDRISLFDCREEIIGK